MKKIKNYLKKMKMIPIFQKPITLNMKIQIILIVLVKIFLKIKIKINKKYQIIEESITSGEKKTLLKK